MNIYCLICEKKGETHNKVVKKAPIGLCCDECSALTVSTCDKLGGIFGGMKGWTKCKLCGHTGAGHYDISSKKDRREAEERLEEME
jgi:hypothetical protein